MSEGIRQVHWGRLPPGILVPRLEGFGGILAIWPAPVNADACFAAAGFEDFADCDDAWDEGWRRIVVAALGELERAGGMPHVRVEATILEVADDVSLPRRLLGWMVPSTLPLRQKRLSLVDQVIAVTTDDQLGEVCAEFGEPAKCALRADLGHPILWIGMPTDVGCEALLEGVARALPKVQTSLDWQKLLLRPGGIPHSR